MAMIDYRRTDERDNIRPNPFWVRSSRMDFGGKDGFVAVMDDNEAVIMSFPQGGKGPFAVIVHAVFADVIVAFVGGAPLIAVGTGTIPTDFSTDGATVGTQVDAAIADNKTILSAVAGFKVDLAVEIIITPADTTVPVIYAALTSGAAVTAGALRLSMLVSEVN